MPIEIKILVIAWVVMLTIVYINHWSIHPSILNTPFVKAILYVLADILVLIATPAIVIYTVVSF